MSGEGAQGRIALHGFMATLWCVAVIAGSQWLHLTWRSFESFLWIAGVGAALALGLPRLAAQRTEGDHGGSLAVHWAFGAALFAPFAVTIHALATDGSVTALAIGGLIMLCGVAAAAGGSRASASVGYSAIAALVAASMAVGLWDLKSGDLRSENLAEGRPGASLAAGTLRRVDLELRGPLTEESIQIEGFPALDVSAALLPGETRGAVAWIVGPRGERDWPKAIEGDGLTAKPVAGEYQCPGWAKRVGPPLHSEGVGAGILLPRGGAAVIAALVAAIASTAVLRSRELSRAVQAVALLVSGLLGSMGAHLLAGTSGGSLPGDELGLQVAVLEGRRLTDGGTEWVEFRRSFGGANQPVSAVEHASKGQFEVADPRGPAGTALELAGPDPSWRVVTQDPSVALDWRGPFEAGMRLLVPDVNTWGSFHAAWERDAAGTWTSFGPLRLGERPAAVQAGEAPPGWCGQGLPQGGSIFLGRLEQPLAGTSETWIRLSGFRSE